MQPSLPGVMGWAGGWLLSGPSMTYISLLPGREGRHTLGTVLGQESARLGVQGLWAFKSDFNFLPRMPHILSLSALLSCRRQGDSRCSHARGRRG